MLKRDLPARQGNALVNAYGVRQARQEALEFLRLAGLLEEPADFHGQGCG